MELLSGAFAEVLATALAVALILVAAAVLAAAIAGHRSAVTESVALALFAFALLGFVTGCTMSDSREPSVAAVMPAALTLIGGVAAFLIGSRGVQNQTAVAGLIVVFSLGLYVGSYYGGELRALSDDAVHGDLVRETNRHTLDLQRLIDYAELVQRKREIEQASKIDLSGFQSTAAERK
ncbi:MAG TPA: hypothetical protein VGG01_09040 [Xanthobacteraceae bacterium]